MLRPVINPDNPPSGDLFNALNWLEALCRTNGVERVTENDVRRFLAEDEGRPDLAKVFSAEHLCAFPDASR